MDVIAYVRAGIDNVVAIMGVALTKFQIDSLKELKNLKTIFLCFDNDTAGVNATYENGIKLLANGFNVYVVDEFENNIKDSDELINSKGKDGLIEAAQKYSDFIIFTIKNKLFKILPLDELKKNIEYIINLINLYGDQIFMSKYVDEIHKYTSLDKQDIIKKISFNNKNDKIISIQQNKYYKPHINEKNNNFIEEKEESVHSASKLSVISQEYHKVIEPLSKTINLLLSNLIRIMIANQNYVEIISHNISINIQGEDEEINDILKTIYYMHLKNIPITKESVHDKLLTINKKNSNSVIEKFNAITSMDTNIGKINKNLIITYIKKIADCRHNININLLLYMQSKD
ncbi:hypothetical protein FACS189496_3440 [Bacilli bacterium]|nr:hypothetical protein FACS189496_3440 [Bacilli bacterium]